MSSIPTRRPLFPNEDVITAIAKKLGKRILVRKRHKFVLADDIRSYLQDMYVVEIDNWSKAWMVVAPRGGRGQTTTTKAEESYIVSRKEWEEEEDKGSNASSSVDFVNGSSTNKDEVKNDMVAMKDDISNCSGASLSSLPDLSDEHASLSTKTTCKLNVDASAIKAYCFTARITLGFEIESKF
jgi:hypothetical protein